MTENIDPSNTAVQVPQVNPRRPTKSASTPLDSLSDAELDLNYRQVSAKMRVFEGRARTPGVSAKEVKRLQALSAAEQKALREELLKEASSLRAEIRRRRGL